MSEFSGFNTFRTSLRTLVERGPALVIMFLFLGVISILGWDAAAAYSQTLQINAAAVIVLLLGSATAIALNTLVDSSTKIELSSMYLTDYKGIIWTTASLILGLALVDALLVLSSSLFWLPLVTREPYITMLVLGELSLTLTEWYAVIVQVLSVLLTLYLAARCMVFPALVAVENENAITALRRSWHSTQNHRLTVTLLLITALIGTSIAVGLGIIAAPVVMQMIQNVTAQSLLVLTASATAFGLFTAIGTVYLLSVVATAYSNLEH